MKGQTTASSGPRITPFLWFDSQAEEAAGLCVSMFADSRIIAVSRYPEGSSAPAGSVMTVDTELDGQRLTTLNAGPMFKLNEAFSLVVRCVNQEEMDCYWKRLLEGGGTESMCGWLKDRFGVSWQVIPDELMTLLGDPDPKRAGRAAAAMLGMKKIDITAIRAAAEKQPE
jgi:predicted 3-demethylubiquinone-9 3-methyltransferase (glyoxalase superfamily)